MAVSSKRNFFAQTRSSSGLSVFVLSCVVVVVVVGARAEQVLEFCPPSLSKTVCSLCVCCRLQILTCKTRLKLRSQTQTLTHCSPASCYPSSQNHNHMAPKQKPQTPKQNQKQSSKPEAETKQIAPFARLPAAQNSWLLNKI